jgi:hypothetical protein
MSRWILGVATLALALALAACSPTTPSTIPGTATITVTVPESGAPNGGIIRIRATRAGLSELDLEVPIAKGANQAAVLGAMRLLMPAEWQEQTSEAGNSLTIQAVDSIEVDSGTTRLGLEVTTTWSQE